MSATSNRRWASAAARRRPAFRSIWIECAGARGRRLLEGDAHDLVGLGAVRRGDFHVVAGGLADQGPRQRRGDGETLRFYVCLVGPDDLIARLLVRILVYQGDGRPE